MGGQLEDSIKLSRLNEIIEVQNDISEMKNKALLNSVQETLLEMPDEKYPEKMLGRTRTNKIVSVTLNETYRKFKPGNFVNVSIIKANRHSLEGKIKA